MKLSRFAGFAGSYFENRLVSQFHVGVESWFYKETVNSMGIIALNLWISMAFGGFTGTVVKTWVEVPVFSGKFSPGDDPPGSYGFLNGVTPLDGLFHWKNPNLKMDDDWGYPYDLGNLHIMMIERGAYCI